MAAIMGGLFALLFGFLSVGVWIGIAGAFLGGAVVVRLGVQRTLFIAMILGAISNLLYLLLSVNHGNLAIFTAVIGGENLAGGFLGTAAVAWLSSLVNREYTATQYALFSSLYALPGKIIASQSGKIVEASARAAGRAAASVADAIRA